MPRIPRNSTKAKFFHTMVQGIEKSFIFDNPASMKNYLSLIYKNANRFDVDILAYCIMDNHAHILLHVKSIHNMVKFFRCVNTSYAKYFNSKSHRVGYVFRNRYKSEGIYTVKQLFNTINYIHNNPIKAKICSQPEDYQYSSYNEFFESSNLLNKEVLRKYFKSTHIFKIKIN